MNEIWTEKYRPRTLDDVVGQKHVTERLKSYVASRNMPHLLLTGPAGTGKTTCSLALARGMFGDEWKGNFIELNASDERGIDVVRGKIKEFARTSPLGGAEFKIIFMDEADALTSDAQAALRRTMEKYSGICRFILSCNYSSKIIDPIQSRCAVFRFKPLTTEDIREFLQMIVTKENVDITDEAMAGLVHVARGDMRRAVNSLQVAASLGKTVDLDLIYQKQVFALVREWLRETGGAVVSVVHDLSLARAYGTHAVLMRKGRIISAGEIDRVMTPEKLNEVYSMDVYDWMRGLYGQWSQPEGAK